MAHSRLHAEPKVDLEPLLYRIHASTDSNGDWSEVLELVRDRLGGRLATFSRHHLSSGQGSIMCEVPANPAFRSKYSEYAPRNPWFLSSEAFTPGRVMTGNELLSNRDLMKTDFYRDLLKPHGLFHWLCGVALRSEEIIFYVGIHRGPEDSAYGEREKAIFRAILAHLSLALENRWRLRQAEQVARLMRGVADRHPRLSLLVHADGRVVHCNRSTAARSVARAGLRIEGGRLSAVASMDRAPLAEAIREISKAANRVVDNSRTLSLSVPGARHPAVVLIQPAGQLFRVDDGEVDNLVLVSARSPDCEHDLGSCAFVKQFGLSPAQARVSVMIISGRSLADTARALHVSDNTARSHLKQIFQKTNTHGQIELVHLHARICGNGD